MCALQTTTAGRTNMIFAILRDNKPFEIIAPEEHVKQYNAAKCGMAA